jgi:hypothetical protein
MRDLHLAQIVKDYLAFVCDKEWDKMQILDLMRGKQRSVIKEETQRLLPSMFKGKTAWPLVVPIELPQVKLDLEFISKLRVRLKESDTTMDENMTTDKSAPRLSLPANVTADQLTLDNFSTLTGRRFRVTTEQKMRIKAGTLTREQAFQEFLKELRA